MKRTRKKHNAAFKACPGEGRGRRWRWRRSRGTGRSPSWRVGSGFIRTKSTIGRGSCWTVPRAFSRAAVRRWWERPARGRLMFCTGRSGSSRSKMIFWHESSANEPSATSRAGRARGRSAAGITAVPVAGGVALFGLSPTGRGQRGGPRHHGTDRPAISGPALLRLAPDGGLAGDPRPCGQSQTGPAPDAVNRAGGDLPASEHEQASRGAQNLPVLAERHHDRTGQSGLVFGRHLHPNGQGLPLSGGRHGLGEPSRAGVAVVQHPRRRVLCRGPQGSTRALRPARDLQYRPG